MDRWVSGLNQRFTKPPHLKKCRGFESHSVRQKYMYNDDIKNEDEIKKKLTDEQYRVLREKGTEMPFSGRSIKPNKDGVYACALCGNPLFKAEAKFDSGTGWPSFDEAIPGAVKNIVDDSHGMIRTEIVCAKCDSHLGHVFDDGPTKTGKRYCTNSVCFEDSQSK